MKKLVAMLVLLCGLVSAECVNPTGAGWKPMDSAPLDGTVIQIVNLDSKNTFYGLYKWNGTLWVDVGRNDGTVIHWLNPNEPCLMWQTVPKQ